MKQCPKCAYERNESDQTPDYECPKCGVIYTKYIAMVSKKNEVIHSKRKESAESISAAPKTDDKNHGLTVCKACGKVIPTPSKKCPYCRTDLSSDTSNRSITFKVIFILFCAAIIASMSSPNKTNQERLDEHHEKGEFLGYEDGDKFMNDMYILNKAAEEAKNRGK